MRLVLLATLMSIQITHQVAAILLCFSMGSDEATLPPCVVVHVFSLIDSSRMDPDGGAESQKAVSLQWKSYKLVQDPIIRRVAQKIYRYDGVHFSVPVGSHASSWHTFTGFNHTVRRQSCVHILQDSGFPPVGELRDPRPRRLWSRYTELSLPVPKFKVRIGCQT